jgi:hypothetical protein
MIMASGAVQSGAEVQTEAAKAPPRRRRRQQDAGSSAQAADGGTCAHGADGSSGPAPKSLREDPEEAYESIQYSAAELEYQKHATKKLHLFIEKILGFVDVWPAEEIESNRGGGGGEQHGVQLLRGRPDLTDVDAIGAAPPKPSAEQARKSEQEAMDKASDLHARSHPSSRAAVCHKTTHRLHLLTRPAGR